MADNKQYITQPQANGNVLISEDVIFTIISQALTEVEGFVGLSTKPAMDVIGKKNWGKGVKIVVSEDDSITIDCNVVIAYGQSVVAVAKAVQEAATNALESMANIKVSAINVNVCGIVRK